MHEIPQEAADGLDRQARPEAARKEARGMSPTGPAVLVLLAAVLFAVAWQLPSKTPITAGWELWFGFALIVLRDTLVAGGILALAVAVSCFRYRPIVVLDRWFFTCDRRRLLAVAAVVSIAGGIWVSYFGLGGVPHIPDEVAMLFQAKNFARGQLYAAAPPMELRKFFAYEYILMDGPRWYGKYFMGPSLLLVPGVWLGAPWIVNPLLGGVAVVLFYALGKELLGEKVGRVAAVLAAISPFRIATYGVMMSHGGCLILAMLFALYLIRAARDPQRLRYWCIAGAGRGAMVNFRPLTALVLAIPLGLSAAVLLEWRRLRGSTGCLDGALLRV